MVVEAWLTRAAETRPDHTALHTPAGAWSYAELLARASTGAAQLAEQGVSAGERVAIALPAGLDFACALHACLLLGAIAVPLDLRLSVAEQGTIAAGCVFRLDAALDRSPHAEGDRFAQAHHELDATAVVIHTSGTSSAPKPIELTYGNLLWSALGSAVALGLDPNERWLCALPLSHVGGLSILVRSVIYATTAIVHERFETEPVLHALQSEEVTLVSLVATTLSRLLDAGLRCPPRLRCAYRRGSRARRARAARARRGRRGQSDLRLDRELLAGHDHARGRAHPRRAGRRPAVVLHACALC
jgi:O-succinylbenzoic acid--CoA ligase